MACDRNRAIPIDPPMVVPNDRDMMKYSPPPSTRRLVAISAIASAVGIVTACPRRMIHSVPRKPVWATAYPKRRKRIAPSIVLTLARNTGAVPKP